MDTPSPHPAYDLDVLMPVTAYGKYRKRMRAFQQFGLLNNSRSAVRLTLLTGTEDATLFTDGWNLPVRTIGSRYDHPAAKIYDFYAQTAVEEIDMARWLIRVDDDSTTDIDGLVDWLDAGYDWRECHYLMSAAIFDSHPVYRAELAKLGYPHLLRPSIDGGMAHEHECALLSQPMMRRILENGDCRTLFAACAEFNGGYGDHVLAMASRMTGFTPAQSEVLWCFPEIKNFSLLGGDFFHIHLLAPDLAHWAKFQERCFLSGVARPLVLQR